MPAASSRPELWKFLLTQQKTTIKTNPSPPPPPKKKGRWHELLKLWKLILNKKQQSNPPHPPPQKGRWHELLLYTVTARNRPIILSLKKAEGQLIRSACWKSFLNFLFTGGLLRTTCSDAWQQLTQQQPPPPHRKKKVRGRERGCH